MILQESPKKDKQLKSTLLGTYTISFAFPIYFDSTGFLGIDNVLSKLEGWNLESKKSNSSGMYDIVNKIFYASTLFSLSLVFLSRHEE